MSKSTDSQQQPPNILFILIDDMGWTDIGPFGSSFYETPNLDRFAKEGMLFTDAYASCPVCSPTRASLLTGKYPARVGVTNFIGGNNEGKLSDVPYLHYLPLEEKSLAKALKEGGYETYHVGKWHLGDKPYWPEHHGFDINIGGCDWGSPKTYFSPYGNPKMDDGPVREYLTDRLTDEAIKLLKKPRDKPFFMFLSHYAVHIPIQSPPELVKKYEKKAKDLGFDKLKTFEIGEQMSFLRGKNIHVKRRLIQSDPAYAAMVENLDMNIGRVLNSLEELELKENTIVVFTSDNGGLSTAESSPTCNLPLNEGKGWMYEGGTREPCLIRWPKVIKPGTNCSIPIITTDFYPTFLDAAKLPFIPNQHCDGVSILPLFKGEQHLERDCIFWHYPHYSNQGGCPGSSIRMGDYKLIEFFENNSLELYNLKDDIGEKHNLVQEMPDIVKMMYSKLQAWQKEIEAKIPSLNPYYPQCFSKVFMGFTHKFSINDDGQIVTKMQFSSDNPEVFDVPLADLIDDFLGIMLNLRVEKENYIGILQVNDDEKLVFNDTQLEQQIQMVDLLGSLLISPVRFICYQVVDDKFKPVAPALYQIDITTSHSF